MKKLLYIFALLVFSGIVYAQELEIKEHKEFQKTTRVIDAKFSSFRNFFALSRLPYTFEVYDRNWNKVFSHRGNTDIGAGEICFSPDEKYLAIGSYKGINDIALVSLKEKRVVQVLRGHTYRVHDLQFSYNNLYLASVSYDKKLVIWKNDGDKFIKHQLFDHYEDQVRHVAFSYDDRYLLTADNDGFITIYELDNDKYLEAQKIKAVYSYIEGVDYHPLKHEFTIGNSSALLRYRLVSNKFLPLDSIKKGLSVRNDIHYSPTGELLTVPHYQDIRILKMGESRMEEIDGIYRHTFDAYGGRFSDDGKFMATFAADSALIIWDISPVEPSRKSQISSWVGDKLTYAQRKILTHDVIESIFSGVDKDLVHPRGEFETSSEYEKRRKVLEEWTLSLIQKKTEEKYKLRSTDNGQVSIPVQSIIGYNADRGIYKIRFLETEAGVEIPIPEAKKLKDKWNRSSIVANKTRKESAFSYDYSNFQLKIPGVSGTFSVTPIENPFKYSNNRSVSVREKAETPITETKATPLKDEGVITHALLFATNVYDSFSELVNPVLDANTIAAELAENYGVKTEVVLNPSLTQTAEKLRFYASKNYSENENLIVFFAGHGVYDEVFKEGYVISSDSRADDISKTSYLSHSNLRTMINNIGCKHIFLVMDVCFGGTIDPYLARSSHRGAMEMYSDIPREEFIERKTKHKTRLYLTSGGNEYVPDGRSGFHSPFARRFIEALRMYGGEDGILTTSEILQYVEKVNPQPRFGEFGDNEPGSDFILISK